MNIGTSQLHAPSNVISFVVVAVPLPRCADGVKLHVFGANRAGAGDAFARSDLNYRRRSGGAP